MRGERCLCHICEERLGKQLDEIPVLYRTLEGIIGVKPTSTGKSAAVEAPAPCNIDALNLTATGGIPDILVSWVTDWYDLLGWYQPQWGTAHDRVTTAAQRLRVNLPWAAERHPAAGDFAHEIAWLHSRAQRVIDGDTPRVPLGACECGGRITANPATLTARCSACFTQWRGPQLAELADAMRKPAIGAEAA
ncbi:hypothetical protein SSP35_03_03260 [Streptomyces sp. NBRC 110611]|uniref:hypothetical protein n=1 Tax=Streptomyces sp. NBRC 110611 TaxID=1621259 RepID=UPI0008555851|nr:hypothetical protein [Streptomyces sp. NBRC 110611]GAU66678.1 hypothetical protein SSP35_03_03260 [Streptomyces sp. NBRC 110611]